MFSQNLFIEESSQMCIMKLDKEKQQISLLTSTFSVPLKIISLKTAHWIKKKIPPFPKNFLSKRGSVG